MADSDIEWTDKTWNPVRGCALVSPGCTNCYAMKFAHRFSGEGGRYEGLTRNREKGGPVWTGSARFVPEMLDVPMHWRTPQKVFVNSMSDLFHQDVTDEQIAAVFGVMAACPQHTFQILTKRAERLPRWFEWLRRDTDGDEAIGCLQYGAGHGAPITHGVVGTPWPLRNVWLGVSVEDQQRADERIPHLFSTPAAVRFLSCEPLLGPLNLQRFAGAVCATVVESGPGDKFKIRPDGRALHWVIVGGESGRDARPCALEWIERVVGQCRASGVPVFVKQLGAYVVSEARTAPDHLMPGPPESYNGLRAPSGEVWAWRAGLTSTKGEALQDIPEHLRVREWPAVRRG